MEFVDTNVLVYAQDKGQGAKYDASVTLLERLVANATGTLSVQVLIELYATVTRKLKMPGLEAEQVIADLAAWRIHTPALQDVLNAAQLQRRYRLSWWDSLILRSAQAMNCTTLWTEDFTDGQRYGSVVARNPFRERPPARRR